jgi:hypothetical protein
MRKLRHHLLSLLALLVAGGGVIVLLAAAGQPAVAAPSTLNQRQTMTQPAHAPGVPAIHPTQAGTPAFTEADVLQFLDTHGFPAGLTLSGTKPVISQVLFVTSKQANDTFNTSVSLPDTSLICYVALQGPFSGDSIPHPPGAKPATFQTGHMVFDAQTGNLLEWGVK